MLRMSACTAAMFAVVLVFVITACAPSMRVPGAAFTTTRFPDISTRFAGPTRESSAPTTGNQGLCQTSWQLVKGVWADAPDDDPPTASSPTPWGSLTPHVPTTHNWTTFKGALGIYSTKGPSVQHLGQVEARPTYSPLPSYPPPRH